MGQASASYITQSKYYSSAFNSAIFDGPVRIYFAQYQESLALELYFLIQKALKDVSLAYGVPYKSLGAKVFVMVYPNQKTFEEVFDSSSLKVEERSLGQDHIIGMSEGSVDSRFVVQKVKDQVVKLMGELALEGAESQAENSVISDLEI